MLSDAVITLIGQAIGTRIFEALEKKFPWLELPWRQTKAHLHPVVWRLVQGAYVLMWILIVLLSLPLLAGLGLLLFSAVSA